MALSLQYDTGFFRRAYITISLNPHYLTIEKNAIFDLDHPFLYHMLIVLLLLTYMMVSFMTVQEDFIGFFYPQTTRAIGVTK